AARGLVEPLGRGRQPALLPDSRRHGTRARELRLDETDLHAKGLETAGIADAGSGRRAPQTERLDTTAEGRDARAARPGGGASRPAPECWYRQGGASMIQPDEDAGPLYPPPEPGRHDLRDSDAQHSGVDCAIPSPHRSDRQPRPVDRAVSLSRGP